MNYWELCRLFAPEITLVLTAGLVLLLDLARGRGMPNRQRMGLAAALASAGCLVAWAFLFTSETRATALLNGMGVIDPQTNFLKHVLLLLTILTAMISIETEFTDHVGEYFALLLLATVGMMFLVSSENILMIFVSLELLSLSLYVMTAFNKRNPQSAEAALKYFLFGGMAAAFTLFGLSLVYGLSGETSLREIARQLPGHAHDPLFLLALLMTVVGFGFKVAAVPFHLWAPDAYQGAPLPSAAFIASGSKVASFFILAKFMMIGLAGTEGSAAWRAFASGWVPALAVLAALSMLLGNLAAIAQKSVRRLLAYSAIAQAGYMLVGLLAHTPQGLASMLYYVITYALTTIGAFAVVAVVQEKSGDDSLATFAGLRQRSPLLAGCMMIFMLSLAGIPPLAGFFGKFYLFTAALNSDAKNLGLLWLVILAIAMSTVSLYYYLQVLKAVFVQAAPPEAPALTMAPSTRLVLILLALAVVLLGAVPGTLLEKILSTIP